jgi:transforming growth factor-beta-induced protein
MISGIALAALTLGQGQPCKSKVVTVTYVVTEDRKDLATTAVEAGSFKTLVAAVKAAGLLEALQGTDQLTVFAPTDEAFAKLPKGTVETLLKPENKAELQRILKYHIVKGAVPAANVKSGAIPTLAGAKVTAKVGDDGVKINDANVVKADVHASNGIIHVIDSVLLPPKPMNVVETAKAAGKFKTLLKALEVTKLDAALADPKGDFTVFAPTDEAFAKLGDDAIKGLVADPEKLATILKFHVIAGKRVDAKTFLKVGSAKTLQGGEVKAVSEDGKVKVNGAEVLKADIETSNGVIHVIDTVLLP